MHIIKISPQSFKIILSKEDLGIYGEENIFENETLSKQLLSQIIDETNRLYDNPFKEGTINAEFFESKEGGGELFITKAKHLPKSRLLVFETKNSDNVFMLCKSLCGKKISAQSTLFCLDDTYYLVVKAEDDEKRLFYTMNEFGKTHEKSEIFLWYLQEHAKILVRDDAILHLSAFT